MSILGGGFGPNILTGGVDGSALPNLLPPLSIVTQQDIDRMTLALASPERQVTLGNQTITYRSIDDLLKARDALIAIFNSQNNAHAGKAPRPKRTYAFYAGRGYD